GVTGPADQGERPRTPKSGSMVRRILCLTAAAGLLWSPAAAQFVVPGSHAGRSGTGSTNVPFGRSTAVRLQAVYDSLLFAPGPHSLDAIALRADEAAAMPGKRVDLELRLSTFAPGVVRVQSAFAQNRGPDETVVLDRRIVDLSAYPAPSDPQPFLTRLPFDRAFGYDPQAGALTCDFVVFGQAPGAYTLDATWLCDSPTEPFGAPGCGPTGRPLRADSLTLHATWGASLALRVFDAPPGATTGLMLGTRESGTWGGVTLPFDLAGIGAHGCTLSLDPVAIANRTADATGQSVYEFFVPSIPTLVGTHVRFQGLAVDPSANPLGVSVSQAARLR